MAGIINKFIIFLLFTSVLLGTDFAQAVSRLNTPKTVPYKTYFFDVPNDDLRKIIQQNSELVKGESSPPESNEILRNRAQDDLANLQRVLATQGYYDAELDFFLDKRTTPVMVYLKIKTGPLYKIGAFVLKSDPPNTNLVEVLANDIEKVGISLGQPAKRDLVQQATLNTINYLQTHGYPFAKLKADRVVIDRSKKEMQIALLIQPGGMARFGNTILQDNGGVTGEFIKSRLKWKKGDIYSEQKVLDTIQSLYNTKLFKEVKITHDDRVDQGGFINLYLKLVASDRNIVRPLLGYTPGLSLEPGISWEKRNFANRGDILITSAVLGKDRKKAHGRYIVPDFKVLDLNLTTDIDIHNSTLKPYTMTGVNIQSVADYPLTDTITGDSGLGLEPENLTVQDSRKDFRYLKLLLGASFSNISDETAPKDGVRVRLELIPYMRVFNRLAFFAQMNLKPDFYLSLSPDDQLVLHGWLNAGASPGAGSKVVPANKLFYNDALVRGYKFQMAGILNNNIPTGGRASLAFGGELQYYFTDTFSILAFIDVGTNYDRQFPDFKNSLLYGVGGGMRYNTGWGTWRLDVASPIRRRTQDSAVEIYAGLDRSI